MMIILLETKLLLVLFLFLKKLDSFHRLIYIKFLVDPEIWQLNQKEMKYINQLNEISFTKLK